MTAPGAGAVSSAMFNHRGSALTKGRAVSRGESVSSLYAEYAAQVERLVARRAGGDVQDACQIAWERLLGHEEVDVQGRGVIQWLVITAMREAWKRSRKRELSFDALRGDDGEAEWFDPAGDAPDPLAVVLDRDDARRRLARLTDRERQFLALQALGSPTPRSPGPPAAAPGRPSGRSCAPDASCDPAMVTDGGGFDHTPALVQHDDADDYLPR